MAQKVPAATNISLKALVDKSNNRVIFVEADNDFIDVLFGFMTIPMGKILSLARDHSTPLEIGCLNKLYQSIEKLDVQVFRSNACRDMLLLPHSAADSHCKNLKIKVINNAEATQYFRCSSYRFSNHSWLSYYANVPCPSCSSAMCYEAYISVGDSQVGGVFVKERARVIITDDLQVIPPLSAASISLFTKLGATNSNTTEELTFSIGVEQSLPTLKLSLACVSAKFGANFRPPGLGTATTKRSSKGCWFNPCHRLADRWPHLLHARLDDYDATRISTHFSASHRCHRLRLDIAEPSLTSDCLELEGSSIVVWNLMYFDRLFQV